MSTFPFRSLVSMKKRPVKMKMLGKKKKQNKQTCFSGHVLVPAEVGLGHKLLSWCGPAL